MNSEQPNPFAPPQVDSDLGGVKVSPVASHYVLATRGERFLAALIDAVLFFIPIVLVIFGLGAVAGPSAFTEIGSEVIVGLLAIVYVLQFPLQWYLIVRRGQTLGKIALNIRIEHLDGRPVNFLSGVILRSWILSVANLVLPAFWMIDALFIFNDERRCLHDLIAETRVVAVDIDVADAS